jgi:molybdate transport system regulatory protein
MARLMIRIGFDNGSALGPGKVRLLELVAETGSIRKAAIGMKMSYRRAWLLLQALEAAFGEPLVLTATGGRAGGGASLTALGRLVVDTYRSIETGAAKAVEKKLNILSLRVRGARVTSRSPGGTHRRRKLSI